MDRGGALYRHESIGAVECLGCGEVMEIPARAVLRAGARPERVRDDPENLLLWIEMQELDHRQCQSFQDAEKARQARAFRKERTRLQLLAGGAGFGLAQNLSRSGGSNGGDGGGNG